MTLHVLLTDSREKAWAFYKSVFHITMTPSGARFSGRVTKMETPNGNDDCWAVIFHLNASTREVYDMVAEAAPDGSILSEFVN